MLCRVNPHRTGLFQRLGLLWLAMIMAMMTSTRLVGVVHGQLTCTLGARDEDSCLASQDDDGSSCVWCTLSSFGVCLNEAAAEAAEQSLPGVNCDRNTPPSADDDITPKPPNPPKPPTGPKPPTPHPPPPPPPKTDDAIKPNDDKVPDNFWNCLNHDKAAECKADKGKCTWCKSKAGYGLCMSGPATKQAQHSHFFKCDKTEIEDAHILPVQELFELVDVRDPLDASCITAYLQDPTQEGCTSATDQDGDACEWCSLAGLTNVCLTPEQAQQGASLGITCDGSSSKNLKPQPSQEQEVVSSVSVLSDPSDPSCLLAYVRDPSQEGCTAGVDQDGNPCQFCTWMGFDLCLTSEQVDMGQAAGIACDAETATTSITTTATTTTTTTSTSSSSAITSSSNVMDVTCLHDFWALHDPQPSDCEALVDEDGEACEYCSIQVQTEIPLCLTVEQAALATQVGGNYLSCSNSNAWNKPFLDNDMLDPSCIRAFVQGGESSESCTTAHDEDGLACQYCTRDAVRHVCATATQADLLSSLGFWCDNQDSNEIIPVHIDVVDEVDEGEETKEAIELPDNFLECLQHYQQEDCAPHGCTWCSTQVGLAFCTPNAVADAMKDCTFFDCQYQQELEDAGNLDTVEMASSKATSTHQDSPLDATCMEAGFHHPENAQQACANTTDQDGNACVWCHSLDNVVGLCFSAEQAGKATAILQCDGIAVTSEDYTATE